jgi:undecaprenyl-diphosphatase
MLLVIAKIACCLSEKTSMVTIIEALILAIIQGLTEWLPVSSSGHLVIAQQLLGLNPSVIFDLLLHIGTLFVVLIAFRKDIIKILKALVKRDLRSEEGKLAFFIIVGSVPIAIIGFTFKKNIELLFSSLLAVGIALLINAGVLFFSEKRKGNKEMGTLDSFLIGIAQAVALIPGVSRSGLTVSTGLINKIDKQTAFKYSFLLSIPAILGATLFEFRDISTINIELTSTIVGTGLSMIVGYVSLKVLQHIVMSEKFHLFAYYCTILGVVLIIYTIFQ